MIIKDRKVLLCCHNSIRNAAIIGEEVKAHWPPGVGSGLTLSEVVVNAFLLNAAGFYKFFDGIVVFYVNLPPTYPPLLRLLVAHVCIEDAPILTERHDAEVSIQVNRLKGLL